MTDILNGNQAGQLSGKVALITGGSSGIGAAVAARFLAEGACVVTLNRSAARAPKDELPSDRYVSVSGDVRSPDDNRRALDVALDRFGKLDVFVGNAGIYDNRRQFRSFDPGELDAAFDELFGINVKGYMLGALTVAQELSRTRGCIIFTSSVSGAHAGFGGALYVAAKHAIHGLTKQLALELAPSIRVNAVAPGYVPTQLRGLVSLGQDTVTSGPQASDMPLQVLGEVADFAAAYSFLASDACSRIATGTILQLDGGSSIRGPRMAGKSD
jgi:NAD(P)-dependent dehydrogenase (short-subunit alcohol dehydrogenase family)